MSEEDKRYIVAALTVSSGKQYQDCILAAEDDFIPATHNRVYGPASREDCEQWMAENCESGKPTKVY
jgi:hypothetical protein